MKNRGGGREDEGRKVEGWEEGGKKGGRRGERGVERDGGKGERKDGEEEGNCGVWGSEIRGGDQPGFAYKRRRRDGEYF